MALATSANNVLIFADTNTFVGPLKIRTAVLVGGSGTSTASIANGASVKILDLGSIAASTTVHLTDLEISIRGGETITATLTGTGAKLYLYV